MDTLKIPTADRIDFISALDLKEPNEEIIKLLKNKNATEKLSNQTTPSADIDSGSMVSFVSNVSDYHKNAVLNTSLLAQLNSDKLYDRFDKNQIMNWYKNYQKILGICGWTIQNF